jgi:hypothetical protein
MVAVVSCRQATDSPTDSPDDASGQSDGSKSDGPFDAPTSTAIKFPRLLGMNIGQKNYDDPAYQAAITKYDAVILGFYPGWHGGTAAIRTAVQQLKQLNPQLLVGQTVTVPIGSGYVHLRGSQDPAINNGAAATSVTVPPGDGVILICQTPPCS